MDEEFFMIKKNKTWQRVDFPQGKEVTGLKWIYKTKFNKDAQSRSSRLDT